MSLVSRNLILHGISRRTAFSLAGTSAAVAFLSSCGDTPAESVPDIDPLVALSTEARSDASAAQASIALLPDSAAVLTTIMTERTAHADALDREIVRARATSVSESTTAADTSAPATTSPVTLAQIKDLLTSSSRTAASLGKIESGYRAGLLGSISAACAVHAGVLLP